MHQPCMLGASADPPCKHAAGRFIVSQDQRPSPGPVIATSLQLLSIPAAWVRRCPGRLRGAGSVILHQRSANTSLLGAQLLQTALQLSTALHGCPHSSSLHLLVRHKHGVKARRQICASHPSCHTSSNAGQLDLQVPQALLLPCTSIAQLAGASATAAATPCCTF